MRIILDQLNFPEGPCFDSRGRIWLVEKDAGNLIRISGAACERFEVGGAPNGIAIDNQDIIWFCDSRHNSIRTFNPATKLSVTIAEHLNGHPLKMPNDLAFDKFGNLLFTCPGDRLNDDSGYICCLGPDKALSKIYEGMYYPNGLALNKEQNRLYVAETGTHKIWQFDWHAEEKTLKNPVLFVNAGGQVGPDGMAFDEEGNLYVAVYGSGKIKIWDSSGVRLGSVHTSGKNPTNCAIDPYGEKGLIITEAEKGILLHQPLTKKGIV